MSTDLHHESVLDKPICLSLNSSWAAIGFRTVRQAIVALNSESNGEPPLLALDMELNEDGTIAYANPLTWEEWVKLPVRPTDFYVQTKDKPIRAPLVVVTRFYNKIPFKRPRLSTNTIYERDNQTCQYSGKKLSRSNASIDHVIPRAKGGKDDWTNLVLADKHLNSLKGDRYNHEVGLKLLRQPKAPPALPISATLREPKHPTHLPFLMR